MTCEALLILYLASSLPSLLHNQRELRGCFIGVGSCFLHHTLTPEVYIEVGISEHKMVSLTFHHIGKHAGNGSVISSNILKDFNKVNGECVIDQLEVLSNDFFPANSAKVKKFWIKINVGIIH